MVNEVQDTQVEIENTTTEAEGHAATDRAKAALEKMGQWFSVRVISVMDDATLQKALDTVMPIQLKLQQESEYRAQSRIIDITPLLAHGATEDTAQKLKSLFRNDNLSRQRTQLAEAIIDTFRKNGRTTFSLSEFVTLLRQLKGETIYGHVDDLRLRIVVGAVLGKTGMNLQQVQAKGERIYAIP